ncbi:Psmd9 [Symbiodinium sp. KB8]|nr:Psmd9 [Symbiodinium sp. KB8]
MASREALKARIKEKDAIELQIRTLMSSLGAVGLHGALVDGFPRADVDIPAIREARQAVHRLQNDHRAAMADIALRLEAVHAAGPAVDVPRAAPAPRPEAPSAGGAGTSASAAGAPAPSEPFARVTEVTEGGPAAAAGLCVDDEVLVLGELVGADTELSAVAGVVRGSVGKALNVIVRRGGRQVQVALTPGRWAGPGVLGMRIAPASQPAGAAQ